MCCHDGLEKLRSQETILRFLLQGCTVFDTITMYSEDMVNHISIYIDLFTLMSLTSIF